MYILETTQAELFEQIFEKEQLVEWFKDVRGEQVMPAISRSLDALTKDGAADENLGDRF